MASELPGPDPLWVSDPPPRQLPSAELLVAPPAGKPPLRLVLLADEWEGAIVHWNGSRSVPCLAALGDCDGCRLHGARTWNGYLPVMDLRNRKRAVWVISWSATVDLGLLRSAHGGLRGLRVTVSRLHDRRTARVVVTFAGRDRPEAVAEASVGWVRGVMQRVWESGDKGLSVDQPGGREQ